MEMENPEDRRRGLQIFPAHKLVDWICRKEKFEQDKEHYDRKLFI